MTIARPLLLTMLAAAAGYGLADPQKNLSTTYQTIRHLDADIGKVKNRQNRIQEMLDDEADTLKELRARWQTLKEQDEQTHEETEKLLQKLYILHHQKAPLARLYVEAILKEHLGKQWQSKSLLAHQQANIQSQALSQAEHQKEHESNQQKLSQLQKRKAKAQSTLVTLKQALENISPSLPQPTGNYAHFEQQKGQLSWPVACQHIVQHFGQTLTKGLLADALVIECPKAEKVKAIHQGWVVHAGWLNEYRFLVIIDHGQQYFSLYGYNDQVMVQKGHYVNRGDVIAKMSNRRHSEKPRLYLALKHELQAMDPEKWLQRKRSA